MFCTIYFALAPFFRLQNFKFCVIEKCHVIQSLCISFIVLQLAYCLLFLYSSWCVDLHTCIVVILLFYVHKLRQHDVVGVQHSKM